MSNNGIFYKMMMGLESESPVTTLSSTGPLQFLQLLLNVYEPHQHHINNLFLSSQLKWAFHQLKQVNSNTNTISTLLSSTESVLLIPWNWKDLDYLNHFAHSFTCSPNNLQRMLSLCIGDIAMPKKDTDFGFMEFIVIEQLQHLVTSEWYRRRATQC